ncbi:hypothetical protein QBZ16_003291 [Prototheca wickerhamii]|uniref:Uncharacterized protein n=1 Tax=Prototheca wickerhamii TaxID=3111 RepID=A0AAD9MNC2_PROWI|nr:hypothetical protein QBZ16_003291 [Prototheca wickerhamii]
MRLSSSQCGPRACSSQQRPLRNNQGTDRSRSLGHLVSHRAPQAKRNDPRPCLTPQSEIVFETRRAGDHSIPPPASTPLVVRDRGSAAPHFMRSTLNLIPQTPDLYRKLQLPLGFVINPLAPGGPKDEPVPVVDLGPGGPVRCSECRAYANPYFRFVAGGERMICNFCGAEQPVPPGYGCGLDLDGRRRDLAEHPELTRGSVDVVATAEYAVRPPMPPAHLFPRVLRAAAAVAELPVDGRTRVGLLAYDAGLTHYDLGLGDRRAEAGAGDDDASTAAFRTLVVGDVDDDPYCPLPSGGVVPLTPATRAAALAALRALPAHAAALQSSSEAAGGAALAAAVEALRLAGGGRVHAFPSTLARRGAPASRPRDTPRALADRDALDNLLPDGEAWADLARRAVESQVHVDAYCLPAAPFVDVASLATLSRLTAGTVRLYSGFWERSLGGSGAGVGASTPAGAAFAPPSIADRGQAADTEQVTDDLCRAVRRPAGLEAVGRLRVSTGLAIGKAWGAFQRRTPTDLLFPGVDGEAALAVSADVEEKLADRGEVYAQFALLYTSAEGRRLVRVHTLALPITTGRSSAFRGADVDALLALCARRVAAQAPGKSLGACRDAVMAAAQSDAGQLLLPEALQLLPVLSLGLTKCPLFRNDARLDDRALWHHRLLTLPAEALAGALYPRLLRVSPTGATGDGPVRLPDALPLSAAYLETDGVYLLENGFEGYLFVSRGAAPDALVALLGVPALEHLGPRPAPLPRLDTPASRDLHALVAEICRQRRRLVRVRVLPAGPASESSFYAMLLEDRAAATGGGSYSDCLRALHRAINTKLA